MKFFDLPYYISWFTWIKRRILCRPMEPKLINISLEPIKLSSIGILPTKAKKSRAKDYTSFLSKYFSTSTHTYVYPEIFEYYLDNSLVGVEICDKYGELVGTIFSWSCGSVQNTQAGLVTWFCVRPDMRKLGLGDSLLHALQVISHPQKIHFFRNDGWLKSPLPPLWTDYRVYRKRILRMTTAVHKVSLMSQRTKIYNSWKKNYPEGLILDDPKISPLVEVWEYKKTGVLLILQQTFENEHSTSKRWCEILYWVCDKSYLSSICIEAIIDALPYEWIEAPVSMPRLDYWTHGGQSSWSVHGLDPGSPVLRPILPLTFA